MDYADPVTTCKFNTSIINKSLGRVNRLIAGKLSTEKFINYEEFPNLSKKTKKIKSLTVIKKITKKAEKPDSTNSKTLSFKQFFPRFFPGCVLSTHVGDIYIPEKLAMDYYNEYLKSNLPYNKYDLSMSI